MISYLKYVNLIWRFSCNNLFTIQLMYVMYVITILLCFNSYFTTNFFGTAPNITYVIVTGRRPKSKLHHRAIVRVVDEGICQSLFVELNLQSNKFLVGLVYLCRGDMPAFVRMHSELLAIYLNIVITRDFICDLFHPGKVFSVRDMS